MPTPPSNVPFISPPATFNGNPVPRVDWDAFSEYGQATPIFQQVKAALATVPGFDASTENIGIVDGIESGEEPFVLNTPVSTPPEPTDISCWEVKGNFSTSSGPYSLDESVGDLIYRSLYPNASDFQAGHFGGSTLHVRLLGPYDGSPVGLAEFYWGV